MVFKEVNIKSNHNILTRPKDDILIKIIQCFFDYPITEINNLIISVYKRDNSKDLSCDEKLIENFEKIIPDLLESYNNKKLQKFYDQKLTFCKCISILKQYLLYFNVKLYKQNIIIYNNNFEILNSSNKKSKLNNCSGLRTPGCKKYISYMIGNNFRDKLSLKVEFA